MARLAAAKPVLDAAARWREDCLLGSGSIFTNQTLWTRENAEALQKHYSHNLDEGEGDFFQKFESQLADAPAEAVKLAAEALWVIYLIISSSASSGATKRLHIKNVFGWSGAEIPDDHWALGDVLDQGVAHPGTAYQTHRWRELVFFVDFLLRWTPLPPEQRAALLTDPWAFSEWLDGVEGASRRQLPHVIRFLLFPDSFERIASSRHKRRIVDTFSEHLSEASEAHYTSRTELDRAVLSVREAMVGEYGDDFDFYEDAVAEAWRPAKKAPVPKAQDEAAAWLKGRFGDHRVWILASGEGGRLWSDFKKEGIAAIGWDSLGDLGEYASRDEVAAAITNESGNPNPTNDSLALWEFVHVMESGDVVIARKGSDHLVAHGVVTGPYVYDDDRSEYQHTRTVDWTPVDDWRCPVDRKPATKSLTDFTKYPAWVRDAFGWLEDGDKRPDGVDRPEESYTLEHALSGLFMTKQQLQEILDSLAQRRNLILEGPPGVGKTFIARRVAWALIGRKAKRNVEFVQFHQSYGYEDFIQGYRPNADGGFELRNGVFHRFCQKAASSDEPHVFIIDEINRGNLSRIFGGLMLLIEAEKRGPDHAVPLTYSPDGERFYVPDNVHVLGMMNTADRSLAMVDYALRRRFAFVSLKPAYGSETFTQFLLNAGVEEGVVRSIEQRFRSLNQSIRDDVQNLGPGFEVGHSYFVPSGDETSLDDNWYRSIVRTQVLPLLREYWFDRPQLLARFSAARAVVIPVRNLYYLLCYAWDSLEETGTVDVQELDDFDRIEELFATVLARGVARVARRGLDRSYIDFEEELAGVRGKIELGATIKRTALVRQRLVCSFEDLSPDVIHNQIIASTLDVLARHKPLDRKVRPEVRLAISRMRGVSIIPLSRQVFSHVHLDRNRRDYRFLINVCRLLHDTHLVDQFSGESRFTGIDLERITMWRVFENFAARFYEKEQRGYRVRAQTRVDWYELGRGAQLLRAGFR